MIAWLIEAVLGASLLMLLVLAARPLVAGLCGAEWAYALWLLPVVVPLLPSFPSLEAAPAFTLLLPSVDSVAAPVAGAAGSGDWLLLVLALWLGGAIFFAVWQQSTYSAFMLHLGPQAREAVPASFGGIKVLVSDAVDGPVALGIFNRRIVVPVDFGSRYNEAEQRLALEHELVHHRRLDLVWNWVALGMLTLNWFNPIAHFAFRAFRADQELACDAAVTRHFPTQRHHYACALVKSASEPGLVAICALNRAEFLKRRLKMMKAHRASWARTLGGGASLAVLGVAGMIFATPVLAEPEAQHVVVAAPGTEIISKSDVATLRVKCGGEMEAITCSGEEARDPAVRSIMARTMERIDARIEQAVRKTADARRAREAAQVQVARHQRDARRGGSLADPSSPQAAQFDSSEYRDNLEESLARVREQLAELDGYKPKVHIHRVMMIARKHVAATDLQAIRGDALRATRLAMIHPEPGLSSRQRATFSDEAAEARREAAEARDEALREAAEARQEALQEAAEARQEALREAAEARKEALREAAEARREAAEARGEALREAAERRELAKEMRELRRELDRGLRHLPKPRATPAAPAAPPAPAVPGVVPVSPVRLFL